MEWGEERKEGREKEERKLSVVWCLLLLVTGALWPVASLWMSYQTAFSHVLALGVYLTEEKNNGEEKNEFPGGSAINWKTQRKTNVLINSEKKSRICCCCF